MRQERDPGPVPFSRRDPPVVITAQVVPVADWEERDGAALPPPADARTTGRAQSVALMPYAAPKLRIAAFPAARPEKRG